MEETILRFFQKIYAFDTTKAIIIFYFLCSMLISLTICIRLLFPVNIALINVIMFWFFFCIIPIFAVLMLFYEYCWWKIRSIQFLLIPYILCASVPILFLFKPSIPGYFFSGFQYLPWLYCIQSGRMVEKDF